MTDEQSKMSKAKTAGAIGALVALLGATTGVYTAVHGTHTTTTAHSDAPVVVNRPHDANGSPLPVTASQLPNGQTLVIVGHGAPGACVFGGSQTAPLPDRSCTPGVVNHAITVADICPHLGSKVVRAVSQSSKDKVREEYNDDQPGEIDHLISLELGGSNDWKNLWPEDGPIPNKKDALENRLHAMVCGGQISLATAQHAIAADWTAAYKTYMGEPAS